MKKILILILLFCTTGYLNAQEIEEEKKTEKKSSIQTIFNSKPKKIRGYAGPIYSSTYLDGELAYMSGMNVAGIINDQYIFGFYNLDLENNVFSNNSDYVGYEMNFHHRGLILGYIFMPKRMIHFNVNALIGAGTLEIYDDLFDQWFEDNAVFVITPSVEAEFNVAKFLRVGIGANYQFTLDVDKLDNYSDNDFSDLGAFVSFRFGWFN